MEHHRASRGPSAQRHNVLASLLHPIVQPPPAHHWPRCPASPGLLVRPRHTPIISSGHTRCPMLPNTHSYAHTPSLGSSSCRSRHCCSRIRVLQPNAHRPPRAHTRSHARTTPYLVLPRPLPPLCRVSLCAAPPATWACPNHFHTPLYSTVRAWAASHLLLPPPPPPQPPLPAPAACRCAPTPHAT